MSKAVPPMIERSWWEYNPTTRSGEIRCDDGHLAFGYGEEERARSGAQKPLAEEHPTCANCFVIEAMEG